LGLLVVLRNDSRQRSGTFSNCQSDSARQAREIHKILKETACVIGCVVYQFEFGYYENWVPQQQPSTHRSPFSWGWVPPKRHDSSFGSFRNGGRAGEPSVPQSFDCGRPASMAILVGCAVAIAISRNRASLILYTERFPRRDYINPDFFETSICVIGTTRFRDAIRKRVRETGTRLDCRQFHRACIDRSDAENSTSDFGWSTSGNRWLRSRFSVPFL
jgi:hypothetical protein